MMTQYYFIVAVWLGLAIVSAIVSYHLKTSISLVEICVGVLFAAGAAALGMTGSLGLDLDPIKFLGSSGAIILTFLAGAELDPEVMKSKIKEVSLVGVIGFAAPFAGCALLARYLLQWTPTASLLAGVALSTTSVAVVYAVLYEKGFNRTDYGKGILGACFLNDVVTVMALGILFSPFTYKTAVFIGTTVLALGLLPTLTRWLTDRYGNRTAAIRTKWVLFILFSLGALAIWSGSEAVLPAYLFGMVLAGSAAKDLAWIRRLRTLTVGFLTPFYFLRAGMLVSLPGIVLAPLPFLALFLGKVVSKIFGLYPVIGIFRKERKEKWYYTLMMSTGLTFGTISAMYGLNHQIITPGQYSFIVAAVISSAVIPTMIAGYRFTPAHLLEESQADTDEENLMEEG